MSIYTKAFKDIYPTGWVNGPTPKTPINSEALNQYTDICKYIESYLYNNPIVNPTKLTDLSDIGDSSIDDCKSEDMLVYDGEKWKTKTFTPNDPIPDDFIRPTASSSEGCYGYVFYNCGGYLVINNEMCKINLKIQWQNNTSTGWCKLLKGLPKPKFGEYIYSTGLYTQTGNSYLPMFGANQDKLVRITPEGNLEIYNPSSGFVSAIEMYYLCKGEE